VVRLDRAAAALALWEGRMWLEAGVFVQRIGE
jgi:hypothetical protein